MPTPHPGTPRYRMVAEELRRRIEAGAIPAGALLPAESALMREFGISRGTAREAIAAVRAEGLVVTEHGRGTYVRPRLPVRRLGPGRYRRDAAEAGSSDYQVDAETAEVPATPALAKLFEVEPGTMLLQRRLLHRIHGVPQQLATSYYVRDMVAGTPLGDARRQPAPDSELAQLRTLGVIVTDVHEVIRARMPTTDEINALHLSTGIPVLTITRRSYAGQRVVEVSQDLVLPADRTELKYEMKITP